MRLILFLLATLICQQTKQFQTITSSRQLQTACPSLSFLESYSTAYKAATFVINPTINTNCGTTGKTFNVTSGEFNLAGLSFNANTRQIVISDWSQFQDAQFYTIDFSLTVFNTSNPQQILTLKDSFYLNIGAQNLQYQSLGVRVFQYYDTIPIDYSTAFDPQQPETGWAFDYEYSINATIQNKNTNFFKTSIDRLVVYQEPPEYSNAPIDCVNLTINIRNLNYTIARESNKVTRIFYDNLNFTDLRLLSPTVNLNQCSFPNAVSTITSINQNNKPLFVNPRTFTFNGTDVVISRNQLKTVLMSYPNLSSIQVDRDKVLYIDASASYDTRKQSFKFVWKIEGYPSVTLPDQRVLTLTPEQRETIGINKAGKYYNFILYIIDSTRASSEAKIRVQITPEPDPLGCYQVSLKDIDLETIMTYTIFPLILQAKVTDKKCANSRLNQIVWASSSIDYIFWQNFGNVNTILIDRDTLKTLPKNINIYMSVTVLYVIGDTEYLAKKSFTLLVQKPDLIPVVSYQSVININEQNVTLDGTASYDPQAVVSGTTDIPVVCKWICPEAIQSICYQAETTVNNCKFNLKSSVILALSNYQGVVRNQAHLFTLNITKDSRVNQGFYYITIIDNNNQPKCSINFIRNFTISQTAFIQANCPIQTQPFTFSWNFFNWADKVRIATINDKLVTSNQIIRIPPFVLSSYQEILIIVTVTNGLFQTPIALYKPINDQTQFVQGSLTKNFNQFTSYLANFILTPANWDSTVSSKLEFQMRIKYSDSPVPLYKVLLSPSYAIASKPIQTILPPINYENNIYFDVVDSDRNFMTLKQNIISIPDVLITASTFYTRVDAIVSDIIYNFDEQAFELIIIRLMLYYQAFRQDQIDLQGVQASYFKSMSEKTVNYLYNTVLIDKRLSSITSKERLILVKQNIIELLSHVVFKNPNINNGNNLVQLLNAIVSSGEFYLTTLLPDAATKVYQIMIQLSENQYFSLGESILQRVQSELQFYYYSDETVFYNNAGYQLVFYEIPSNPVNIPTIESFSYPQALLVNSKFVGGSFFLIRNDSSVSVTVYDSKSLVQLIQGLSQPVYVNFQLSQDQMKKNSSSLLTFFCAFRSDLSKSWSSASNQISFVSYTNATGVVRCKSNSFGHYTLFIIDLSKQQTDVVIIPNKTDNQTIDGKWNDTIANDNNTQSTEDSKYVYYQEKTLFMILAILTLVIFVISSYVLYAKYKDEHQELNENQTDDLFEICITQTAAKNRCRLFLRIIQNFNPYINLFLIYNKFLKRWIRNSLLQIYFMSVSIIFAVNQYMLSDNMSELGQQNPEELIILFIITVIIVLFGRPQAIKLMYMLLYEPDSKVEDFDYATTSIEINHKHDNQLKMISFDPKDDDFENKNLKLITLPKLFDLEGNSTMLKQYESSGIAESKRSDLSSIVNVKQDNVQFVRNQSQEQSNPSHPDVIPHFQSRESNAKYTSRSKNSSSSKKMKMDTQQDQYLGQISMQHRQLISEQPSQEEEESKLQEEKLQRSISFEHNKQDNNQDNDLGNAGGFHLPDINVGPKYQKGMFDDDDFNLMDQPQSIVQQDSNPTQDNIFGFQNQYDIQMSAPDRNYFSEYNQLNNNQEHEEGEENNSQYNDFQHHYEGGEQESKLKDIDDNVQSDDGNGLNRSGSADEQAESIQEVTNVNHTLNLRNDSEHHNTEFLKEQPLSMVRNSNSLRQRQLIEGPSQPIPHQDSIRSDQYQEECQLIDQNKKLFINKIIGKWILFIIWGGLGIANLFCIQKMTKQHFLEWISFSLVTFFLMIFVIDSILYFLLSQLMIKSQNSRKIQYYSRRQNKVTCGQVFVILFIGKEKMRDLRRNLNPIKRQSQQVQVATSK
ncbi:UNKNOWN [Stylonychia lemnae]|uniref:Cadg domain containing protein n=1 Tax=Stylonychia lemnae TaxID=5949 RepID=A0A078B549_STYLE|nr:UNKNOWN [Stylonychia lemnae]|eukprot:CDW89366.1 UNKNOWN [Stylonychia lemnae]